MNDFEDEDECAGLLKKALDVDLPSDFNPNSIPQTGEEYLHHVMYERQNCQEWVTAEIDRTKFKNNQTIAISLENKTSRPQKFLPSLDWQNQKLEEFKEFRKYVEFKLIENPSQTTFNEDEFRGTIHTSAPIYSQLIEYAQCSKVRMLQLIGKHVEAIPEGQGLEESVGTWIYALLALLDIPLSPSSCFSLREFAKKCQVLRARLPEDCNENLYVPLNLTICIVARFFNQLDLAD